jgi:CHAD domain-containing protein
VNVPTVHEVEDKYDVDAGFVMPNLGGLDDVDSVSEPQSDDLSAVYFDTPDYRLARHGITLRRRTGGSDAGWHLKLPADGGRDEIQRPLGSAEQIPSELSQLVFARTRGLQLAPVARLLTTRVTRELFADDGVVLAELADDVVSAQVLDPDGREVELTAWREVEVELVTGSREMLRQVGKLLQKAGAQPSVRPSKLAGVLGERLSAGPEVQPAVGTMNRKAASGEVIRSYLAARLQAMLAADVSVRLDGPEAIHDMRIAIRCLESTLGTYRRLMDAPRADDLAERLAALARELGVVRDSQVLLDRLLGEIAEQSPELVLGPVKRRMQQELQGESLRGRTALLKTLNASPYARLVDELVEFVATGTSTDGLATKNAGDGLPKLVARQYKQLVSRVKYAATVTGSAQDVALHQARKSAKKTRYAAAALVPAFGPVAAAFAAQIASVQEILGEHQDSVVAAEELLRLALVANSQQDESAFTFGLLVGVEHSRADAARRRFDQVWKSASDKRYRKWLSA